MLYLFMLLLGFVGGAVCVYLLVAEKKKALSAQKRIQDVKQQEIRSAEGTLRARGEDLDRKAGALAAKQQAFDARFVSYSELENENVVLKRDLHNIDVNLRKLQLDRDVQRHNQETLDAKAKEVGGRYLKDNIRWLGRALTPNNYAAMKQRLLDLIDRCRSIGLAISDEQQAGYLTDLKGEYERVVRAAFEREEQARIKAQIREEREREREIEQELKRLERERAAIQAALDRALAEAKDKYSEEVERLKARLAEAEERSRRAMSQAQLTKSGHVYVISNIGSFGRGVFKIGMTRRLEPDTRVRELSGASVPFPFDVHMMLSSDDAPGLETALHKAFHTLRVNRVNPRKEFFKTDIEAIRQIVEENRGEVQYVADPEALEYHQSLQMSEEDAEFIEKVYDSLDEDEEGVADDE